jgi:hypothetical protein
MRSLSDINKHFWHEYRSSRTALILAKHGTPMEVVAKKKREKSTLRDQ